MSTPWLIDEARRRGNEIIPVKRAKLERMQRRLARAIEQRDRANRELAEIRKWRDTAVGNGIQLELQLRRHVAESLYSQSFIKSYWYWIVKHIGGRKR